MKLKNAIVPIMLFQVVIIYTLGFGFLFLAVVVAYVYLLEFMPESVMEVNRLLFKMADLDNQDKEYKVDMETLQIVVVAIWPILPWFLFLETAHKLLAGWKK